jgi:hypothetical protein
LWLQVNYPNVFGGTWVTAPDPADFHAFIPVDLTTAKNIYRRPDGSQTIIMRVNGHQITMQDYARQEFVLGEYGGQMSSFEAVFSPRGPDGRPMRLFDRTTGDRSVARVWQRYDIAEILHHNWRELEAQLNGKIHVYVGTADNYFLEKPALLLRQTIAEKRGRAAVVFIPGRTHTNVYENGIAERIWQEMWNTARPANPFAKHPKAQLRQ